MNLIKYQITGPKKLAMAMQYHSNIDFIRKDKSENVKLDLLIKNNHSISLYYNTYRINKIYGVWKYIDIVKDILDNPSIAILHLQDKIHRADHETWSFKSFLVHLIKFVSVGTVNKV